MEDATASPVLTDDERLGLISAARRQQAHDAWLELNMIADFILGNEDRLRASIARRDQRGRRDGEYAVEELAFQLNVSQQEAGRIADLAVDLKTRLPRTFDGLRTGVIDAKKADIIHRRTRLLSDADAATADEQLAGAAPRIRPSSLNAKAAKLARKLDPDLFDKTKEEGKTRRRVEAAQEESGNAYLAGRELEPAEVLAAKAALREEAHRLRRLGLPGTLDEIEARVYTDRLNGIDTAARHGLAAASAGGKTAPSVPALINLLVPASAAAGQPGAVSDAGAYGFLDGDDNPGGPRRRLPRPANEMVPHPRG